MFCFVGVGSGSRGRDEKSRNKPREHQERKEHKEHKKHKEHKEQARRDAGKVR